MPALVGAGLAIGAAQTAGAATAASASSFIQPWMVPLATSGVRALHNLIAPDRQAQILSEVLAGQTEFRNSLARRAFGHITPDEASDIREGGAAQVNAVAGNVASRGLGSSPAGADIVSEAQQQVFTQARREALAALPAHDQAIAMTVQSLFSNDNSFNEDLSAITTLLQAEINDNPEVSKDPNFIDIVRQLWESLGSPVPQL